MNSFIHDHKVVNRVEWQLVSIFETTLFSSRSLLTIVCSKEAYVLDLTEAQELSKTIPATS